MKLWKKVYLVTLTLTILFVNLGIYGLFYITYKQMLSAEKKHCIAEFMLLQQSFSENVKELEKEACFNEERFREFLYSYGSYYNEYDFSLAGWYCRRLIYTQDSDKSWPDEHIDAKEQIVTITSNKGHTTLYISAILDSSHIFYQIGLQKELTDFDATWNRLTLVYIGGSLILSVGLSLVLGIVVKYLLKPIRTLICVVDDIRSGNLSGRVFLHGTDELSELGTRINEMAVALEENVTCIREEAVQKQQLIDNLAHEMNTPITSIQGFARYLQIGNIKEAEQAECLEFILHEAMRLKEISTTLLDMAKFRNGKVEMQKFSCKELCQRIFQLEKTACEEQQVNLMVDCEIDSFFGNEVLIESLLRNLIHNSLHATNAHGSIVVAVKEEFSRFGSDENETDIRCMILSVADTGCGMPSEEVGHIFEPFYRLDKSRSRALGGSGLGLPLCKTIVELHHGSIEVETKEGYGTTVIIKLPIE